MTEHPRGILRNKSISEDSGNPQSNSVLEHLDRQQVIENTRLNAKLSSDYSSKGDEIRAKIAEQKHNHSEGNEQSQEHLKWDEINLYKTEQEKSATMKIDEPKTPYEGGFNPEGEYYREDNEDDDANNNEIPAFDLGESEYDKLKSEGGKSSLRGGEVYEDELAKNEEEAEEGTDETPLTAEERHRLFEEKRKQHYHMKAIPLKQKIDIPDDEK